MRPAEPGRAFAPTVISTARLLLTPLREADADSMVEVLGDERLHQFTGGRPADRAALRERFGRLAAGSGNSDEIWLNWIVRAPARDAPVGRAGDAAVGTVQATVTRTGSGWTAAVAWVIGVPWQGNGYASEAARALVEWLGGQGAATITAYVHPDHRASETVAARAGLHVTERVVDGEREWRTTQ